MKKQMPPIEANETKVKDNAISVKPVKKMDADAMDRLNARKSWSHPQNLNKKDK